ncbi:MAG: amino acid permease [Methanospirillum sp.]
MAERPYRRSLGLFSLVSLGLGGTVGSGIFVAPGVAAGLLGPAALFAWLLVGLSSGAVAFALASVPADGENIPLFQPVDQVFGTVAADLLMGAYVLSSVFGCATICAGIGQYLAFFGVPSGLLLPAEIAAVLIFLGINLVGVALSGAAENLLTVAKIVPLIVIALLLLPLVRPEHLQEARPITLSTFVAAVLVVFWPYTGFEIGAIPVGEARDRRAVRTAVLMVAGATLTLYLVLNLALVGSIGADTLAASPAPVALAADHIMAGGSTVVGVIGIVAMLSALNAYLLAGSRVLRALATRRSSVRVATLSARGAPAAALLLCGGGCAALLLVSNRFELLASLAVVLVLAPYLALSAAVWRSAHARSARAAGAAGALSTGLVLALSLFSAVQAAS